MAIISLVQRSMSIDSYYNIGIPLFFVIANSCVCD